MGICCILSYVWPTLAIIGVVLMSRLIRQKKKNLQGKHVMVTGGSSGIGLSVAHIVARMGASVTLVARNVANLEKAEEEVKKTIAATGSGSKVQFISADVAGDVNRVKEMVREAESTLGPLFMLVNCAGFSRAAKFEDLTPEMIKAMLDINITGSIYVTQEAVKSMKRTDEGGIIVFASSQAGLFGLYGYTAYSASKAALVKLAEALHMELKPSNITVTVCVPPDTDTPGFQEENKTKPTETMLISESAGLFKPDVVAHKLVDDALSGKFFSTVGLEGFMLITTCAGMCPITDCVSFLSQVFLSGIFRVVSVFYLWTFARIVESEHSKRIQSKKRE